MSTLDRITELGNQTRESCWCEHSESTYVALSPQYTGQVLNVDRRHQGEIGRGVRHAIG